MIAVNDRRETTHLRIAPIEIGDVGKRVATLELLKAPPETKMICPFIYSL